MTYQVKCKCGSEFYLSVAEENYRVMNFAREEINKFWLEHNCTVKTPLEELPEDWKV